MLSHIARYSSRAAVLACFATLCVFATVLWSCSKDDTVIDPCADINCQNGGTCVDGTCNCPAGYEGDDCGYTWNGAFAYDFRTTYTDSSGAQLPFTVEGRNEKDPDAAVFRWNRLVKATGVPVPWDNVRCEITDRINFTFRPGQLSPSGFFPQYRILAGGGSRNEAQTLITGFIRLQEVQSGAIVRYDIFAERIR